MFFFSTSGKRPQLSVSPTLCLFTLLMLQMCSNSFFSARGSLGGAFRAVVGFNGPDPLGDSMMHCCILVLVPVHTDQEE